MPSNNHYRNLGSAAKSASKYASKASLGLARWATTDHTGLTKFLANFPSVGFADTLSIILVHVVLTILGAIASGFMVFVLIAYVIPALFFL